MNFFYKESKSKKKRKKNIIIIFVYVCVCVCVWKGEGVEGGGRWMNRPKPICSFNFFKAGGIIMHKCKSHVPDKLNL